MKVSDWKREALRVLVVEDDEVDALAIHRSLRRSKHARFETHHVRYAREALDWLDQASTDVVLLDLSLPDASGIEGVRKLQARAGSIPIVVLTGQDDEDLAKRLIAAGVQDYIVKGRDQTALLARSLRYAVERQRNWDQMRRMQRMESLGRIAGGVAHDFNNMLSILLGHLELTRDADLGATERWRVGTMIRAVERCSDLTHKLLAFGRKQTLRPRTLNPVLLLEEARSLLASVVGEEIELEVSIEAEPWLVQTDPTEILQAVMNLALNARDAMPRGGRLSMSAANLSLPQELAEAIDIDPGDYVRLKVEDTGAGIPANVLERIFDPFFTTKSIDKGTGLGLSMVYGTVRQSGGGIHVSSTPGVGTSFSVFLPRFQDEQALAPPETELSAPSVARNGQHETLLLIEDEPDLRVMIREMLQCQGYKILEASCGEEALRVVDRCAAISLVLCDVVMPGMSGPEVIQQILARIPAVKIAYMTGYDDEKLSGHGLIQQETHVLKKPFSLSALRSTIRELLAG